MGKIPTRELRKYLKSKSHEELVDEVVSLAARCDEVAEHYLAQLGHGEELLKKYQAIIRKEFFPTRGFASARLSVCRKAINDHKRLSHDPLGQVELMLFYVETGVRFTNDYGDINEAFYRSIESAYYGALKLIVMHGLQEQYRMRCEEIVTDTKNIGWGFHDNLNDMFCDAMRDLPKAAPLSHHRGHRRFPPGN